MRRTILLGVGLFVFTSVGAAGDVLGQPILDMPADSATGLSVSPTLGVTAWGPSGDLLTVTYTGRSVNSRRPAFSLIIIPDTQHYTAEMFGGSPVIFRAQTQWIVRNRERFNTVFVNHVGDMVNNDDQRWVEWNRAWYAMSLLEDTAATHLAYGLPYSTTVGNHDQSPHGDPAGTTTYYNDFFGVAHFSWRPYYGGHFGSNNDDHFCLFSASGIDFIVVSMEYDTSPNADVLAWADSLLAAHSKRWAIVSAHSLIGTGNPAPFTSQGQAIYDALKENPNLFLMVSGHVHGEGRRSDTYQGRTVHTVMADYQMSPNGGDGWLRIMTFYPDEKVIRVKTYSPTLDQFETDADSSSQFTLPIDLKPLDGWRAIGTEDGVPSGSNSKIVWPGLCLFTEYEWYVTVNGSDGMTSGPTWRFTTRSRPPTASVIYPAGRETLGVGQTATLRWNATDDGGVRAIDLLLSRASRWGPFEPIAAGIDNTGRFEWPVSGPETENAYLVVVAQDDDDQTGADVSDAAFTIHDPTGITGGGVAEFGLDIPSPNPLRGPGTFTVTVPRQSRVRAAIYDVLGREVAVLADRTFPPGRHRLTWTGRNAPWALSSGVYFVKIETPDTRIARKFVLVR